MHRQATLWAAIYSTLPPVTTFFQCPAQRALGMAAFPDAPSEGKDRAKSRLRKRGGLAAGGEQLQQEDSDDEILGSRPLRRPSRASGPLRGGTTVGERAPQLGATLRPSRPPWTLTPVWVYPSCLPVWPLLSRPSAPTALCHCAWPVGVSLTAVFSLLETPSLARED